MDPGSVESVVVQSPAVESVTVILNPASGRGQGRARRGEIERLLEASARALGPSAHWSVVETTAPGSGAAQAAQAAREGADVVAAAGGDGTYGEVLNGLVGTNANLGIIPLGTGNDFARTLGVAGDLTKAIHTLYHGQSKPIDVGEAKLDPGVKAAPASSLNPQPSTLNPQPSTLNSQLSTLNPRLFVNVAGCGFDAVVAQRVNQGFRRLRGTTAYVAAVVQCLMRYRAADMRITVDGESRNLKAMLCSIANSRTYGGGMVIAPDARIDDGWFDLCILQEATKFEFLTAFPRVFKGTHVTHPKVTMLRGREIRVESDPPMPVLVDGDILGETPVTFTIQHHAIEVMAPWE